MKFKEPYKYSALDSRTTVKRETESGTFEIRATPSGIELVGRYEILDWVEDAETLAYEISKAWADHMKLKPKLMADIPR